jgi:hypothetical protein
LPVAEEDDGGRAVDGDRLGIVDLENPMADLILAIEEVVRFGAKNSCE